MSQADAALSRVIAETSATPSASQYWERKRPLFRQLAIRVVQAMQEGLSKQQAVARSITELRGEVLQRVLQTDSARQAYWEWFERRGYSFLASQRDSGKEPQWPISRRSPSSQLGM